MTVLAGPVRVTARIDPRLSRWLWLVKWVLVVPHLLVLGLLWVAFGALSVVAFVAVVITGRYPHTIFEFNLGVLRWSWRVAYYSYGALGTDRYPPFTLRAVPDYAATLDIAYPQHLSRGLVWVKWLLALPHYVIIAFFVGGGSYVVYRTGATVAATAAPDTWSSSGGLIGLLVLIVGVTLLFTGRYPRGLFDLLLGMHRWVLRVAAYTALMTDEYPPFRLDMGGTETPALVVAPPGASIPTDGSPARDHDASGRPPVHEHWTGGRIVTVVVGAVLLLSSIGTAAGATALLTADRAARDADGFLTTPTRTFTSSGYALVLDPIDAGGVDATSGVDTVLGDVRITATGRTDPVFVGIGPADAVERYLADVDRERLVGLRAGGTAEQKVLPGGPPATVPTSQTFWVASASGPGQQQLTWTATEGRWAAAVMNADGSRPVVADLSAAATAPALRWVWIGLYIGAGIALAAGLTLVLLAARPRRPIGAM
jgi:hypothetical protein